MKLYYSTGACSLSPHIALHEAGLPFEAVLASTKSHKLQDGTDYYTINPKGYVALLELDDGTRLAEGPAIVQWIGDQVPEKKLVPPAGTMARYRLQEWLTFIDTEIHKQFSPLFNPAMPKRPSRCSARRFSTGWPTWTGTWQYGSTCWATSRWPTLPLHRGAMDRAVEARHLRSRDA